MNQTQLLNEIKAYLEEEGFIVARGKEWCDDQSEAVLVWKFDGWPGMVRICYLTPHNLPPMITFWIPVLVGVGNGIRRRFNFLKKPYERAIDRVDLLNHEQLIGRWTYRHESNEIHLNHELLAEGIKKDRVLGVLEILMRDADVGESLQKELGGISWVEATQQIQKGVEDIGKAQADAARQERGQQTAD